MDFVLLEGDSLVLLKELEDNSVDSVVTDPPFGISFMNKKWDYNVPSVELWREVFRVLKHGGHALVCCGTRTQHRMVINIEDAGFEIRDVITHHYGSGFPKSMDISKAIDKVTGAKREVAGTPEAKQWEGWGTALKPATEFWTLCRKPLAEKTVAENVLKHGTGGLNIDGCRIECESGGRPLRQVSDFKDDVEYNGNSLAGRKDGSLKTSIAAGETTQGRFPANLILDEYAAGLFPDAIGQQAENRTDGSEGTNQVYGKIDNGGKKIVPRNDPTKSASRFFYVAKASQKERNAGLEHFADTLVAGSNQAKAELKRGNVDFEAGLEKESSYSSIKKRKNFHPTVKPIQLMRYLIRMITPPNGLVLDPYNGSGTTGCAAMLEGFDYVGIDNEPEYIKISEARINYWKNESKKNSSNS